MVSSIALLLLLQVLAASAQYSTTARPPMPPTDLYGKQANIDYDHGKVVNDYSREQPRCTMVDKVEYKDVCEPYTERVCVTQPEEECKPVPFRNCTGVIETKQDRRCFDVTELICGLKEEEVSAPSPSPPWPATRRPPSPPRRRTEAPRSSSRRQLPSTSFR